MSSHQGEVSLIAIFQQEPLDRSRIWHQMQEDEVGSHFLWLGQPQPKGMYHQSWLELTQFAEHHEKRPLLLDIDMLRGVEALSAIGAYYQAPGQ
eukprot:scaffold1907_cov73-Skeletonema_dohrnii-CCMP3373.AAC.4